MMAITCTCGERLVSAEAICEVCNTDLPQSPWPASDWAIDRISDLEAALELIAYQTTLGEPFKSENRIMPRDDMIKIARVALTHTQPEPTRGDKP